MVRKSGCRPTPVDMFMNDYHRIEKGSVIGGGGRASPPNGYSVPLATRRSFGGMSPRMVIVPV